MREVRAFCLLKSSHYITHSKREGGGGGLTRVDRLPTTGKFVNSGDMEDVTLQALNETVSDSFDSEDFLFCLFSMCVHLQVSKARRCEDVHVPRFELVRTRQRLLPAHVCDVDLGGVEAGGVVPPQADLGLHLLQGAGLLHPKIGLQGEARGAGV